MLLTSEQIHRLGELEPYSGSPLPNINVPLDAITAAYDFFCAYHTEEGDDALVVAWEQYQKQQKKAKGAVEQIDAERIEAMRAAAARASVRSAAKKAYDALRDRWWIVMDDGSLEIQGSSGVYIAGYECLRKGQYRKNKKTGRHGPAYCPSYAGGRGRCYHLFAREIVRLAQVFILPTPSEAEAEEPLELRKAA